MFGINTREYEFKVYIERKRFIRSDAAKNYKNQHLKVKDKARNHIQFLINAISGKFVAVLQLNNYSELALIVILHLN